jgi:hypothetical protein
MRGADGNETCPHCFRVMVDLARFDAREDAVPVDKGGWSGGGRYWPEIDLAAEMEYRLWHRILAAVRQWRLNRVLRRYPRSSYCPGCGYLIKRK